MKPSVGIEIGQDTVRIVKIKGSGMVLEIEKMASAAFPPGIITTQGLEVIGAIGVKPRFLEFPFVSLTRFLGDETKGKVAILVDLGNLSTAVSLLREGLPYHVSTVSKGLQDLNECVPTLMSGSGEEFKSV